MGQTDPTAALPRPKRRRLPLRTCLRQGCGRRFEPRSWNQRYCSDPDCRRMVRRWQDRKRQQRRRSTEEGKRAHREAERERRRRVRAARRAPGSDPPDGAREDPRGHGAKGAPICDRPGCFEPPRESTNGQARYCGVECRQAVRRVVDRERKWRRRQSFVGRWKRRWEYDRRSRRSSIEGRAAEPGPPWR